MNKKLFSIMAAIVTIYSTATLPAIAKSNISDRSETLETAPDSFPNYIIAQSRYAFSVTGIYSGTRNIKLKSVSTGNEFDVYYASPIGVEIGDVITVIMDDDRWITLINERTGKSSAVTSVSRI